MTIPCDYRSGLSVVLTVGLLLSGCERGPTEEDMSNCASHRTPTWGDLIKCKPDGDVK